MALSIAEIKIKERKRLYYLEHQQEIKKKCKEYYYAKKVKPKRQRKLPPQQGPFSALVIGVEND